MTSQFLRVREKKKTGRCEWEGKAGVSPPVGERGTSRSGPGRKGKRRGEKVIGAGTSKKKSGFALGGFSEGSLQERKRGRKGYRSITRGMTASKRG